MNLFSLKFSLPILGLLLLCVCVSCSRPNPSMRRFEEVQKHVEQNMDLLMNPQEQSASGEVANSEGTDENSEEMGIGISPYLDAIQVDLDSDAQNIPAQENLKSEPGSATESEPEPVSESEEKPNIGLLKKNSGNKEYEAGLKCATGFECEKNDEEAAVHFCKAAEQGNIQAAFAYGACLYNGRGIAKNYPEALKWLTKAAEQEQIEAVMFLAHAAINGNGMERNPEKAAEWYKIAAQKNLPKAQFALGLLYSQGLGIKKNDVKAVKWFSLAANAGESGAQYFLGKAYLEGRGIARDEQAARLWFSKAHKNGWNGEQKPEAFPQIETAE